MGFKDEAPLDDTLQAYGEIFVMRYNRAHAEQLTDEKQAEGASCWQPQPPSRPGITMPPP